MKRLFRTLRTRLSFWVLLLNMVIFGSIAYVFHAYSSEREKHSAIRLTNAKMENLAMSIERKIDNVEYSLRQVAPLVEDYLGEPDKMGDVVERWVKEDSLVMGGSVAFEPYYYPSKGRWFMEYVYIDPTGIMLHKQLGGKEYDYPNKEWYRSAKLNDGCSWSEPYFDEGGGQEFMITCCLPLRNAKGKVYAVITADVAIKKLTEAVQSLQLYDDSRIFIFTKQGTYLTHWQKDMVGKTLANNYTDNLSEDALEFNATIPDTGWRLCAFCSYDSIMGELRDTTITILAIFLVGLILLSGCIHLILCHEMRPIERLAAAARKIGRGNFNTELPSIDGNDELRSLHDSLASMQVSLVEYMAELKSVTASKERMESELHIAHTLQMNMLPKGFPKRNDLELCASLMPAKEVGGDLYDYFIRDGKLFFTIGDVSGNGIPASLFMAITQSLFRLIASSAESPVKIAKQLNDAISDNNDNNMFVTMFIGIVDLKTSRLTYCNAGHNPPLLMPQAGHCKHLDVLPNIPIGIEKGFDYKEQVFDLGSNGLLVYTDGVTEAEDSDQNLYGEQRLNDVCDELCGKQSTYIIKGITDAIKLHSNAAKQSDDVTILYLRLTNDRQESSLYLKNSLSELDKLPIFLNSFANDHDIDASTTKEINLAIEEAMVNVINYAYQENEDGEITLTAIADGDVLTFTLTDSGKPFDPTSVPDADTSLPIEDRRVGGLGILLIKQMMDSVSYEHKDNLNILTMKKINNK